MKKIMFLVCLMFLIPSLCWGQGQVTRPLTNKPNTNKKNKIESVLPNSTETINGITVNWNGVKPTQKAIITNLIKNLIYVQGGSYIMGSNDQEYAKPPHNEIVGTFYIDKYEVTQKEWQSIMGNNPSENKGNNLPVSNVSLDDCKNFISQLNYYTGLNFRIPTEIEWEYAAKGGRKSNGFLYSGSNNLSEVGWTYENSGNKIHPVGQKKPNELGIFDMSGNISEWTISVWSSNYNEKPKGGSHVVTRDGSAFGMDWYAKTYYRCETDSSLRAGGIGFRIVL